MIPKAFRERYQDIADDEFFACLEEMLPKAFRVNTLKSDNSEIKKRFREYGIGLKQMQWYDDAFVSEDPEIGSTLEHFLGKIYAQELVSMLPPLIIRDDLADAKSVLDGCAAPGSKTTQLAALMNNKGTLVANDISYTRIKALKFNLEKVGALNTVVTNQDLRFFPKSQYGAVIIDAPCSAEGTIRKNSKVFNVWSEKKIFGYSHLQKQLILKGFDLLAPGGVMVYSTCTFAPEENEAVVNYLLSQREAELEDVELEGMILDQGLDGWNRMEFDPEVKKCCRAWPQRNNTGGFFFAKVRK